MHAVQVTLSDLHDKLFYHFQNFSFMFEWRFFLPVNTNLRKKLYKDSGVCNTI